VSDAARRDADAFVRGITVAIYTRREEHPYNEFEWQDSLADLLDRHAAAQSAALAGRLRGLVPRLTALIEDDVEQDLRCLCRNCQTLREIVSELAAALQEPPQ
jgi:hypothetical protein